MTEHDKGFTPGKFDDFVADCREHSTESLRFVPGIEYSDPENRVHVLVWGLARFLGECLSTGELLEEVTRLGGVAVLAHPDRRDAWSCVEERWGERLHGVEVWNRKTDGFAPGKRGRALAARLGLAPFFGLDFHYRRHLIPLRMRLGIGKGRAPYDAELVASLTSAQPMLLGFPASQTLRSPWVGCLRAANAASRPLLRQCQRARLCLGLGHR